MSKINRYDGDLKAFAINSTSTNRTIFGSESQSDTLDDNVNSDYFLGWEIVATSAIPSKQDFNALGFTLGQVLAYLHQMGMPEWNTSQEYPENGYCIGSDGYLYRSRADSNTGNNPVGDDANWQQMTNNVNTKGYIFASIAYSGNAFDTSGLTNVEDFCFADEGNKMYLMDRDAEEVLEYDLATPYLPSSGTDTGNSFSTASEGGTAIQGIEVSNDGSSIYTITQSGNTIYQYDLSTAYDASTATYSTNSFTTGAEANEPQGMKLSPDNTKLYVSGGSTDQSISQYTLSSAGDISTASYDSKQLDYSGESNFCRNFDVSDDGETVVIMDNTPPKVFRYTLSTPYDMSTGTYDRVLTPDLSVDNFQTSGGMQGVKCNPSGSELSILNNTDDEILTYYVGRES